MSSAHYYRGNAHEGRYYRYRVRPVCELLSEYSPCIHLRVALLTRPCASAFGFSAKRRAFTIFCEDRQRPEVSSALTVLRSKVLRPGALDVFSRRDSLGTGFVCRVDLFDGLRELGISGTPPTQARYMFCITKAIHEPIRPISAFRSLI